MVSNMFKKLKKFDEKASNIVFFVSLFIIIIFLFISSLRGNRGNSSCNVLFEKPSSISYIYNVKLEDISTSFVTSLKVRNYNNRYLIEKVEQGIGSNYYIEYASLYKEDTDGFYVKYRDDIIDGIDNKYIFLEYINNIAQGMSVEGDSTCASNDDFKICVPSNNEIVFTKDNLRITYEYDRNTSVNDFDVSIKDENNEEDDIEI